MGLPTFKTGFDVAVDTAKVGLMGWTHDRWLPQIRGGGGKSELHRAGWFVTRTGGNLKESATENIPPDLCLQREGKGEKAG